MSTPATNAPGPGPASPLPALFALSFLCSVGTGIVTSGVYFLTTGAYRFSTYQNYALGFFQGLTYVAAAMVAGKVVRLVRRRLGVSSRTILAVIISMLGLLCFIPLAAWRETESPPAWPIWVMVLLYSPLTGFLWPLVENYVSGGRSGGNLRRALGMWNLFWSSALVVGFLLMGPLVGKRGAPGLLSAQELIAALGGLHLVTTLLLFKFRREPGRHIHEHHEPHPPVYRELLGTFRILLPTSYFVLTALQPYMPRALGSLDIPVEWLAPFAGVWHLARVLTFFALDRWHGWHGRWMMAVASIALLIGGFAATVLGPRIPVGSAALVVAIGGLVAFGMGMATTYTAALYYAMEVGQSDIDAGGTHESLIGLGYTVGPAAGLVAAFAVRPDAPEGRFEWSVVVLVGALSLIAFLAAALLTHHHATKGSRGVSR
jgi:MFS family permease